MPSVKLVAKKIFIEKASGVDKNRKQLKEALNYMREGDTLVVWKLSRLARSLTQIMQTVKSLEEKKIALKVLTQNIGHCCKNHFTIKYGYRFIYGLTSKQVSSNDSNFTCNTLFIFPEIELAFFKHAHYLKSFNSSISCFHGFKT